MRTKQSIGPRTPDDFFRSVLGILGQPYTRHRSRQGIAGCEPKVSPWLQGVTMLNQNSNVSR